MPLFDPIEKRAYNALTREWREISMPFDLPLPKKLRSLWKVKVQDKEALYEEPHVTIWRKASKWRYSLRSRAFLDKKPDPGEIPKEVMDLIHENFDELIRQWDERFPTNRVAEEDGDDSN
ncbi:MAG TPA: hypothetical protein VHX86_19285 [Tepidisphaeraceae bacterium]|jgi:hypothetical protein|nr:hypothetical protein [Tepidisphaeraceae bacterium]